MTGRCQDNCGSQHQALLAQTCRCLSYLVSLRFSFAGDLPQKTGLTPPVENLAKDLDRAPCLPHKDGPPAAKDGGKGEREAEKQGAAGGGTEREGEIE